MKLIFCKKCADIVSLHTEQRTCRCGSSSAAYEDTFNAWYKGEHAIPIGFSNPSIIYAILNQPEEGLGINFDAFVIPKKCDTFINKT